jgi:hypothetical protein
MAKYWMNIGLVSRWRVEVDATDEDDAKRKTWQALAGLVGRGTPAQIEFIEPSHDTDSLGKPYEGNLSS